MVSMAHDRMPAQDGRNGPGSRGRLVNMLGVLSPMGSGGRLLIVAGLITVITATALSFMLVQLRQTTLAEARRNVDVLAMAITEQTSRSLQAGQLVLEDLQRHIREQNPTNIAGFQVSLAEREIFQFMKDRADFLPQVDAFTIIAANGKLVNYSRQWPAPPTDLSDRDYLAFFRLHDTKDAFISAPVRNRGTGVLTSYVARRVNSRDGEFLGMVLAALDLDYFKEFFRALTETAGTTVTLLRQDGAVLTGYPTYAAAGTVLPHGSQWFDIVRSGKPSVFETPGVLASGDRLVSVHPLKDYPLVINVSISKQDVLAGWWRMVLITGFCFLGAVVCIGLLVRAQVRHYTKLRQSESKLRSQAEELSVSRAVVAGHSKKLQSALQHMNQGILMVSADGNVVVCNEKAASMLELPSELLSRQPSFDELVAFQEAAGEFGHDPLRVRPRGLFETLNSPPLYERVRPNGTVIEVQTVLVQGGGLVRTYTDITERRRAQQQVQFLAEHDPLTGLSNRNAFQQKLDELLRRRQGSQDGFVIYYLDLDGFKPVNDRYGHPTGDKLLLAVAKRLRASVREDDFVARIGGDEFCIVQSASAATAEITDLSARLLSVLAMPFQLDDVSCQIGSSIGVAVFPDHGRDVETLLKHADTALYLAKSEGKGTVRVFEPSMNHELHRDALLRQDLSLALVQNQLHLEYQPIVNARTLDVVRLEALLRWTHPSLGPISPAAFIPMAEKTGLIVAMGLWALETACMAATEWPAETSVSVNLSPLQFAGGNLPGQIEKILADTGLAPSRLHLEITEGVLLENTTFVMDAMNTLRSLGVRFSLDDFGTAHAGLAYLRRFPFDVLKIDKSFVHGADHNEEARVLLAAIQGLGAACKLQVVAEGVETEGELQVVRDLRCDYVQGYLTGWPERVPFHRAKSSGLTEAATKPTLKLVGS
jgi:diguanylate cyclase (GGDEF)-like protein